MTQGSLLIRDADESYALTTPTVISGQHDTGDPLDGVAATGAVTEGVLTTPVISFETVALDFPVFVEATLEQVTPASGTGVIDADGNVQFRTSMSVHLDIEVGVPTFLTASCDASPVELVLDSTAPYNPTTQRVTLRDADFSVPTVPTTPQCESIIADNVNDLLSGGGHSLTMTFGGELELPPRAECPTITTLAMAPADEARFGTDVTFTGTVTRDPAGFDTPECEGVEEDAVPPGLIEFRDGSRILGTGTVDPSGVATFTTDALPAGGFDLVAAYRQTPPFQGSASASTPYRVTADPAVTADLPDFLRIGAAPTEFDVTVTNSPLGSDIANGRLTLTVVASPASALNLSIEYQEGDGTWTAVPQGTSGVNRKFARIDPLVGRAIAAGEEVTRRVRVAALDPSPVGPYRFIFELIQVDPVSGDPAPQLGQVDSSILTPGLLGTARGEVAAVGATRLTPTWLATAVRPHTIRQGQTVRVENVRTSPTTIGGVFPTGAVRILFDGQPVPVRVDTTPTSFGYLPFINRQTNAGFSPEFAVPVDAPLGDRTVTVVYEGDRFFAPAQLSFTVRVLAARGPTYTCANSLLSPDSFTVNVEAAAIVPAAGHPGDEVDLGGLDISFLADRGGSTLFTSFLAATSPVGVTAGLATVQSITMELSGGQGTGTAAAFTTANKTLMSESTRPQDPAPDAVLGLDGETASVILQGAPGDEVPVTLDRITVAGVALINSSLLFDCVPLGDPVTLGTVKLAGAALTVDAPQPAREGDTVTLTTQVHPIGSTGLVEFFDGTDSLGLVAVDSLGLATLQTDELPQGTHQLTARFFGGVTALSSTTDPVELAVLVATECIDFAEDGNGAIVRLVYMELLGRCPDQAGYDYWVDRLDDGTSAEAFARAIARTPEAVGKVVDDAYDTMLGRAPDPAGRAFWVKRLQTSGRYDSLLADLGASGEFWSKAGSTNEGFVTRVYERLVNRAPDQGGLDHWVGRLEDGASRRALILTLANLDEPLGRLVALSYDEILGRAPNATERAGGIAHLRSTGDRSGLYAQLMGRSEFDDRAQSFPNPED